MTKKHVRWLYSELPSLVDKHVIPEDTADKLREHYGDAIAYSGRRIALTVCSMLGSLLIGAGIILLLAHNWQQFSRVTRTCLALAPLVAAQLMTLWVLQTGKKSAAWREGTATFQTLAMGASIALVGQTYHIPGDLGDFLLVWTVLTLPLVYLLGASLPAIIYCVGITAWAGYQQNQGEHAILFWALFTGALPHVWLSTQKDPYSPRSAILGWAVSLCLCVAVGLVLEKVLPGLWVVVYSGLFTVLYLAGARWFDQGESAFVRPFHTVGSVGIPVLTLLFTFEFPWKEAGWHYYRHAPNFHEWAAVPDYALSALLPAIAICLLASAFCRGEKHRLLRGIFPIITLIMYSVSAGTDANLPAMIVFNIYMFALGIGTVINGITRSSLSAVNGGMLILASLILVRFFDSEFGFVIRGIVFIVLGAGFLATNVLLAKKIKGAAL